VLIISPLKGNPEGEITPLFVFCPVAAMLFDQLQLKAVATVTNKTRVQMANLHTNRDL
jgi:hypothetical protein